MEKLPIPFTFDIRGIEGNFLMIVVDPELLEATPNITIPTGNFDIYAGITEDSPHELLGHDDPTFLGKILFDENGNWIYDGEILSIEQQESIVAHILKEPS